jgi:hypothetical protein
VYKSQLALHRLLHYGAASCDAEHVCSESDCAAWHTVLHSSDPHTHKHSRILGTITNHNSTPGIVRFFGVQVPMSAIAMHHTSRPLGWQSIKATIEVRSSGSKFSRTRLVLCASRSEQSSRLDTDLPTGPDATVRQAEIAIINAFRKGVRRQLIEMPLPLTGASELDDWCGVDAEETRRTFRHCSMLNHE